MPEFRVKATVSVVQFILFTAVVGPVAQAAAAGQFLDIPAGSADQSLHEFSLQTKLQILFSAESLQDLTTRQVHGSFSPANALDEMLNGTGLKYSFVNGQTVAITANDQRPEAESEISGGGGDTARRPVTTAIPEVLVRGSRSTNVDIRRSEDDVQPYVVIDAEQIQRSNSPSLEDFLTSSLSMNTSVDSFEKNVASLGTYRGGLNLRGLGANQTLILVDGRRIAGISGPGGDFAQTDISGIPLSSVERIEILPASAGAIYGGSATGGVINIIRKHNFSGIDASVKYGNTFDSAARDLTYQINGGFGLGRTQVTMGFTHSESNPLFAGDRAFAERSRQLAIQNVPSLLTPDGGMSRPATGSTPNICAATQFGAFGVCNGTPLVLDDGRALGASFTSVPEGYAGPGSDGGTALLNNAGRYNLQAPSHGEYLLKNPTRNAVSLALRQNLASWLDFQLSGMKTNSMSELRNPDFELSRVFVSALAPNNPFRQDVIVNVPTSAAFLSGRIDTELVDGQGGFIVRLPGDWSASVDRSWSRTSYSTKQQGTSLFSGSELSSLQLSASLFENTGGAGPVPTSYPQPNSFAGPFVQVREGTSLHVGGPVLELPSGPVTLTGLAEHSSIRARDGFIIGDPVLTAGYYPARWQSVDSFYLEGHLPIASPTRTLPFAELLELQASIRRDDYKTTSTNSFIARTATPTYFINRVGSTDNLYGLKYSPIRDITLRASYSTGFLPAGLSQLSQASEFYTSSDLDPRRGGTTVGGILLLTAGNPNVEPERSKSRSIGLIFQPRFAEGARLSVDYVEIRKDNEITTPTLQFLLANESTYGSRIKRGPNLPTDPAGWAGPITEIDGSLLNTLHTVVKSIDYRLDYRWATRALGEFAFGAYGTQAREFARQINIISPAIDVVGSISGPLKWKGGATLSWERGAWSAAWTAQYYDSYEIASPYLPQFLRTAAFTLQGSTSIPSETYHDVVVGYTTPESGSTFSGVRISAGVNNVFNSYPTIVAVSDLNSVTSGYNYAGDPRLRRFFLSISKSFNR